MKPTAFFSTIREACTWIFIWCINLKHIRGNVKLFSSIQTEIIVSYVKVRLMSSNDSTHVQLVYHGLWAEKWRYAIKKNEQRSRNDMPNKGGKTHVYTVTDVLTKYKTVFWFRCWGTNKIITIILSLTRKISIFANAPRKILAQLAAARGDKNCQS